MFMPNDFGNGGGAPQGMGGPFDLQAQLAALPPQIRAQVMARMGMPGNGGMQAGMPDQGMNQTGPMPPPQGGMRPGLPGQGSQSGPIMDPRQGPPGPPQPMPAPGSGPVGGNPWGRSQAGPVTSPLNAQGIAAQQGIYGGGPSGRTGDGLPPGMSPFDTRGPKGPGNGFGGSMPVDPGWGRIYDSGDPRAPQGGDIKNPLAAGPTFGVKPGFVGGAPAQPGRDPGYGYAIGATVGAKPFWTGPPGTEPQATDWGKGTPMPGGGNVLNPMPAPVARPIGNARPARPQMSASDRAAAIAADKAMVGGAPPYVGKPKPMPQTDPPVAGTATDVKPLVGKPAPSPQQDPLQGATKPKPKPKPTLGRNYGPK